MNIKESHFALVLAAGVSRRMGICKTTLLWQQGKTLLYYQCEQFLAAGITPVVVLGSHNAHRQKDSPPGSQVAINQRPERGKTSSILTGLASIPKFSTLVISAVDQPRSTHIYQTLLRIHLQHNAMITAPTYRGKLGHPLLFSEQILPDLAQIREETQGLRQVVQKFYPLIQKLEWNTPEVLQDLNTPQSYQQAISSFVELSQCSIQ